MSYNISDVLRPGDRLDLHYETASLNKKTETESKDYYSKIYDIDEDDNLFIFMPMEKTKLILLPVGAVYEASFYGTKSIYGAKIRIVERIKQNSLFILKVELITELEKMQRREFFRYDCIIGMMVRQLTKEEVEIYDQKRSCEELPAPEGKAVVVDISGGGMRFISSEKVQLGSLVQCRFLLPYKDTTKKYDVILQIVGSKPVANNPQNMEFRGPFYEIKGNDREEIIKYIFEEERRQRSGNNK